MCIKHFDPKFVNLNPVLITLTSDALPYHSNQYRPTPAPELPAYHAASSSSNYNETTPTPLNNSLHATPLSRGSSFLPIVNHVPFMPNQNQPTPVPSAYHAASSSLYQNEITLAPTNNSLAVSPSSFGSSYSPIDHHVPFMSNQNQVTPARRNTLPASLLNNGFRFLPPTNSLIRTSSNNNFNLSQVMSTSPALPNINNSTQSNFSNTMSAFHPTNNLSLLQPSNNLSLLPPTNILSDNVESNLFAQTSASGRNNHIFNFNSLKTYLQKNPIGQGWCWLDRSNVITLSFLDKKYSVTLFHLTIAENLDVIGYYNDDQPFGFTLARLNSQDAFIKMIKMMEKLPICIGGDSRSNIPRSPMCKRRIPESEKQIHAKTLNYTRCKPCSDYVKSCEAVNFHSKQKNFNDVYEELAQYKHDFKNINSKLGRYKEAKEDLMNVTKEHEKELSDTRKNVIKAEISKLPENQQELVQHCFKFSTICPTSRRYSIDWIYTCILMRSLGSRLYDRIRKLKIMPLPCITTINKYIQNIRLRFGFQQSIFETLKLTASRMGNDYAKRGSLLADEMSITESISFNKTTLEFEGFVNLGDETSNADRCKIANHVLVLMFQPFQGDCTRVIGMFLSRGAVHGEILDKLLKDCIIRLDKSGFKVDTAVMDGAAWNRMTWTINGVGAKNKNFHCINPSSRPNPNDPPIQYQDPEELRLLWFISDFPHLLKNLRNAIVSVKTDRFWTPDGWVYISLWYDLMKLENIISFNLKMAFKLTKAHVAPKGFQTMNVLLAYQV